jgi:pilus assembly protein CpaE
MALPPVLLAGASITLEAKLRAKLPDLDWRVLNGAARAASADHAGTAAVVVLGADVESGFRMVNDVARSGARVVVVGPSKDADLILRTLREGGKEFVLADDDESLARAIRGQLRPLDGAAALGTVYSAFGAKGGVGATTLAVNLAGVLQRRGLRTCLVDLNLNMGDVLAFLDLAGGYSISDVVANMRRLDRDLLDATLLKHGSGVRVLSQSHRVEESDWLAASALAGLLHFMRQHFDAVVVDGLRSFDDFSVAAVDASDQILLVLSQEVPAVRDARRCVELFRRLGHAERLRIVVNRFQRDVEIAPAVIAETVGTPVAATIANDYPTIVRAINRGVLLIDDAPRATVTRDLEALAGALGASSAEASAPERRPSLLKRFFGKGAA